MVIISQIRTLNLVKTFIYYVSRVFVGTKTTLIKKKGVKFIYKNKSSFLFLGSKHNYNYPYKSYFLFEKNSIINFHKVKIYAGSKFFIGAGATFSFKSGFINYDSKVHCTESISIGDNCYIGENFIIRDSDGHNVNNKKKSNPIIIGDNCWIGMRVTILPGTTIGNNSIVAAGSLVNKTFPDNVLIGGVPAKILKSNVNWK